MDQSQQLTALLKDGASRFAGLANLLRLAPPREAHLVVVS